MLGFLLGSAAVGAGIGGLLNYVFSDSNDAPYYDAGATMVHWVNVGTSWGFLITIEDIPGWLLDKYKNKELVIYSEFFDCENGEQVISFNDDYKNPDGYLMSGCKCIIQYGEKYSFFVPYSAFLCEEIENLEARIRFLDNGNCIMRTFPSWDFDIPQPYRIRYNQDCLLALGASILNDIINFDNEHWSDVYEVHANNLVNSIDLDNNNERFLARDYIDTWFYDDEYPIQDEEIEAFVSESNDDTLITIFNILVRVFQEPFADIENFGNILVKTAKYLNISEETFCEIFNSYFPQDISEDLEVLEIEEPLTADKIKTAYRKKCQEFHPDKYQNLNKKMQEFAQSELIRAKEAYDNLMEYIES